jgi:hypothetical protein
LIEIILEAIEFIFHLKLVIYFKRNLGQSIRGDYIFDVGANIGVFGLRAIQKGKNVHAYCFEPIPDIAEVLTKNATEFGKGHIHVLAHGVSNEPSRATFTYFPNTPALSTLHPEQWDENPTAFRDAVKGTMKNPPEGMKWMKLIPPIFACRTPGH